MARKSIVFVLSVFLCVAVFGFSSYAEAARKIAYVDLSQTFDKYKKTKDYDDSLASLQGDKEKELDQMSSEIKAIEDKMSLLSEKEKASKQKELEAKREKLRQKGQQIALDLRKERDEKLKEILQDIEKVIQRFAQKNGYDFIFNDRVLLYGSASADVTQDIINQLNKGYKKR